MKAGTIHSLWRFPVKSFSGEKLDQADLDKQGIPGDRAYALIDKESGKTVSAKNVKLFPDLLMCSATYIKPPTPGQKIPPVQIRLADGTIVSSESKNVHRILSLFFKREVTLARIAQDGIPIDPDHPYPTSFMDAYPVSVITTSTLERLEELRPESRFDVRRFRMNVVVKTNDPGFVENAWIGKTLGIGAKVSLAITAPDGRCVMTTLAQQGLPKDNQILRILAEQNSLDVAGYGILPCAGVYGVVGAAGFVKVNDHVETG